MLETRNHVSTAFALLTQQFLDRQRMYIHLERRKTFRLLLNLNTTLWGGSVSQWGQVLRPVTSRKQRPWTLLDLRLGGSNSLIKVPRGGKTAMSGDRAVVTAVTGMLLILIL